MNWWLLLNLCNSRLYLYSLCKNCFLVTLSLFPSIPILLPMDFQMKRDAFISMRSINARGVYMYILLLMYILCICTYIYGWPASSRRIQWKKNRRTMNIYEQLKKWSIMKYLPQYMNLQMKFLIAVNICWQKKMKSILSLSHLALNMILMTIKKNDNRKCSVIFAI